jgi:hypothetical protein
MKTLQTYRLKPNPAGKDKNTNGRASQTQLAGEWVDISNTGTVGVTLSDVQLYHVAFTNGKPTHWEKVTGFSGTLQPGKIVRVHSGSGPLSVVAAEDLRGADHHMFTNRDVYVWNNEEGDTSRLTEQVNGKEVDTDKASYAPNPPEGAVLVRSGDSLIPGRIAA